ncbi:uncharacterized protein LOC131229682 [Magnolia sinica]|uniref:uncharacterized protein LOC131229682 n=1 Tax=Magnolia sinica TaxID=86752 RepID=UPI00265B2915|nr:uncharacterized protein LOC131229682 [Magnolia sinica]
MFITFMCMTIVLMADFHLDCLISPSNCSLNHPKAVRILTLSWGNTAWSLSAEFLECSITESSAASKLIDTMAAGISLSRLYWMQDLNGTNIQRRFRIFSAKEDSLQTMYGSDDDN